MHPRDNLAGRQINPVTIVSADVESLDRDHRPANVPQQVHDRGSIRGATQLPAALWTPAHKLRAENADFRVAGQSISKFSERSPRCHRIFAKCVDQQDSASVIIDGVHLADDLAVTERQPSSVTPHTRRHFLRIRDIAHEPTLRRIVAGQKSR